MFNRKLKSSLAAASIATIALASGVGAAPAMADPSDPIAITDANLMGCVKNSMSAQNMTQPFVPAYTNWTVPSKEQFAQLESITCVAPTSPPLQVVSLEGIEDATSLKTLNLRGNLIEDISPLAGLTSITNLSLVNNPVSDISAISGMTDMTRLDIGQSNVESLESIAGFTKLKTLYAHLTKISDDSMQYLSDMTEMNNLYLTGNDISDISVLENLTELKILNIRYTNIADIKPLGGLSQLLELQADYAEISDLTPVAQLTGLNLLWIDGNKVSDLSPLSALTNLIGLDATSQRVQASPALEGIAERNPIRGVDGAAIPVTDATFCATTGCDELLYPAVNTNVELEWNTTVTVGNITVPFTGKLTRDVVTPVEPTLSGTPTPATEGTQYDYQFDVAGVPTPTVTLESGTLPLNVQITSDGKLTGVPAEAGSFDFTLKAESAAGSVTLDATLEVAPKPVEPTLSGTPTPATEGTQYDYQFGVAGVPTPTVTLESGKLPTDVNITPDGKLTGVPAEAGSFDFTLKAESAAGSVTLDATLEVAPKPVAPPFSTPSLSAGSAEVYPGDRQTVTGAGFVEGEKITLTIFSDPVPLGTVTVGAGGKFTKTFTVPENTQAGAHRVVATRSSTQPGPQSAEAKFTVLEKKTTKPPVNPTPNTGGTSLANTGGADYTFLGWATAGTLIAAAAAVLITARRAKNRESAE